MRALVRSAILLTILLFPNQTLRADDGPRPFVRGSFAAIAERHAGKPLVVAFWSLTCPPCIAEMPLWRETARARPGVAIVLVSTDPPEDGERLRRTLDRHGLGEIESWTFADPFAERLRFDVDRTWRGELPRTYFIGPDGTRTAFSGRVDDARLDAWLQGDGS